MAARFELAHALQVEVDAILGAIELKSCLPKKILIMAQFGVERIRSLGELLDFLFASPYGFALLRFTCAQFGEELRETLGLRIELVGLAGENLPNEAAHLLADFGITTGLGCLALE